MKKTIMAAAVAATLASATSHAAVINLVDLGGVTGSKAEQGFTIAANYWGDILSNDVIINLGVGFQELDPGVIGSTGSTRADVSIADWQAALNGTKSNSTIDQTAVLSDLSPEGGVSGLYHGFNEEIGAHDSTDTSVLDGTQGVSQTLFANTSVLKAVGIDLLPDQLDGTINFSSTFGFDFDPSNGIDNDAFDFISVAIHEIGHALGFVSGVDLFDLVSTPNGPFLGYNFTDTGIFSALDMFRYSAEGVLDFRTGGDSYFSIDGGKTALLDNTFSTGRFNGDGQQASHWKDLGGCSDQLGILDPNSCFGQMGEVTGLDLAAYDAMGWNLNIDALNYGFKSTSEIYLEAVPAPSAWSFIIGALGFVGFSRRRRKRSLKASA